MLALGKDVAQQLSVFREELQKMQSYLAQSDSQEQSRRELAKKILESE